MNPKPGFRYTTLAQAHPVYIDPALANSYDEEDPVEEGLGQAIGGFTACNV